MGLRFSHGFRLLLALMMLASYDLLIPSHNAAAAAAASQSTTGDHGVSSIVAVRRRQRSKIFHPPTGLCLRRKSLRDPLKLGSCDERAAAAWDHTPQKFLMVIGTYYCLQAVGPAMPVKLGVSCDPSNSAWSEVVVAAAPPASEVTLLATRMADGTALCLDLLGNDTSVVVSNACEVDPSAAAGGRRDSQWFKIVPDRRHGDGGGVAARLPASYWMMKNSIG